MSASDLTDTAQNYLKTVWAAGEWSDEKATIGHVAEKMGLTAATVSVGIKKLGEQGFVEHQPYGAITLTPDGRRCALEVVRRHRLIETFLVQVLHYRWDQVHEDAEHMEHAVSDLMIERLDELLGHPSRDPHGDPIPTAEGTIERPCALPLPEVSVGRRVRIEQISDSDVGLLQLLAGIGVRVGSYADLENGAEAGTFILHFDEGKTLTLDVQSAALVRVSTE